jgi:hypothetical protein
MRPKPNKFMPALYGGLVIAGISAIPGLNLLNCLCCAGVLLGGFLAVFFYKQALAPDAETLTMNDCLNLGVMTGIISAIAGTFISVLVLMVYGNIAAELMVRIIDKMSLQLPPDFQQMLDEAVNEKISMFGVLFSFVISFVVNGIFSVIGALIGWSVFKPKPTLN